MLTTEKAFDALPHVVDIFEKLELEGQFDKAREAAMKGKAKKSEDRQRELGLSILMHVVKNSNKCKDSFFGLLAVVCECSVEEAKQKPPSETIAALKAVIGDNELMGFFKRAVQEEQKNQ